MDLSTIIGMIIAVGLMVFGIIFDASTGVDTSKFINFYDAPSLLVTVGGCVGATIASFPFSMLKDIPKHITVLFRQKQYDVPKVIDQIVDMAMVARQNGLLSLEEKAEEVKDPFLKQSILMIVDANDPDKVRTHLETELDAMAARHNAVAGMWEKAAGYAPAFGMIGTLIGLINMLKGLDLSGSGGSSSLGQDMSVALITTFYGCVVANVICNPIAQKLRIRNSEEDLYNSIIVEGVLAIQAGENPQYIREQLLSSLKRSQQKKIMAKTAKAAPGGE